MHDYDSEEEQKERAGRSSRRTKRKEAMATGSGGRATRQRRERREVADDALAFVLSTEAVVSRVETDVSIASEIEFVALTKLLNILATQGGARMLTRRALTVSRRALKAVSAVDLRRPGERHLLAPAAAAAAAATTAAPLARDENEALRGAARQCADATAALCVLVVERSLLASSRVRHNLLRDDKFAQASASSTALVALDTLCALCGEQRTSSADVIERPHSRTLFAGATDGIDETEEDDSSPSLDDELLASLRAATARSEATVRRLPPRDVSRPGDGDLDDDFLGDKDESYQIFGAAAILESPDWGRTTPHDSTSKRELCEAMNAKGGIQSSTQMLQVCPASELVRIDAVRRLLSAASYDLAERFSSDRDDSRSFADVRFAAAADDDDDDLAMRRRSDLVAWVAKIAHAAFCIHNFCATDALAADWQQDDRGLVDRCIEIAGGLGTIVASASKAFIEDEGDTQKRLSTKWAGSTLASVVVAGNILSHDREALSALQNLLQLTSFSRDPTASVRVGTATAASFLNARARRSRRFLDTLLSPQGAPSRSLAVEAGAITSSVVGNFVASILAESLEDEDFHSATSSILAVDAVATLDGIFANLAAAARHDAQPSSSPLTVHEKNVENWLRVLVAIFRDEADDVSRVMTRLRQSTGSIGERGELGVKSLFSEALAERHLVSLVYTCGWETPMKHQNHRNHVDVYMLARICSVVVKAAPAHVLRSCRSAVVARCRGTLGEFDVSLPTRAYVALNAILPGRDDVESGSDDARDIAELCASFLGIDFSNSSRLSSIPKHLARLIFNILASSRRDAAARALAPALFGAVEQQPVANETRMKLIRRARRCDLLRLALDTTALSVSDESHFQGNHFESVDDCEVVNDEDCEFDLSDFHVLEPYKTQQRSNESSTLARLALGRAYTLRPAVAALMSASAHLEADVDGVLAVAAWKLLMALPTPDDIDARPTCDHDISVRAILMASRQRVVRDGDGGTRARGCLETVVAAMIASNSETLSTDGFDWLLPAAVETLAVAVAEEAALRGSESGPQFEGFLATAVADLSRRHDVLVQSALQGQRYDPEAADDARLVRALLPQLAICRPLSYKMREESGKNVSLFASIILDMKDDEYGGHANNRLAPMILDVASRLRERLAKRGVNPKQLLPAINSGGEADYSAGIPQQASPSIENTLRIHASFHRGGSENDVSAALASRRALDALALCARALGFHCGDGNTSYVGLSMEECEGAWMHRRISTALGLFAEPLKETPGTLQHAWEVARTAAILDLEAWTISPDSPFVPVVAKFFGELDFGNVGDHRMATLPLTWALRRCQQNDVHALKTQFASSNDEGETGDEEMSVDSQNMLECQDANDEISPTSIACRASSIFVALIMSTRNRLTSEGPETPASVADSQKCANLELAIQTAILEAGEDVMRVLLSTTSGRERNHICALAAVSMCHSSSIIADAVNIVLSASRCDANVQGRASVDESRSLTDRLASAIAWSKQTFGITAFAPKTVLAREAVMNGLRSIPQNFSKGDRQLEALLVLGTVLDPSEKALATTLCMLATSAADNSTPLIVKARALELISAMLSGAQAGYSSFESGERMFLHEGASKLPAGEIAKSDTDAKSTLESNKSKALNDNIERQDSALCTYARSGGEFVEQHWYNCATCGLVGDKGCCAVCVRVCHAGHDVAYSRRSSFFCDCGAESQMATDGVDAATREILSRASSTRRAAALLSSGHICKCLTDSSNAPSMPVTADTTAALDLPRRRRGSSRDLLSGAQNMEKQKCADTLRSDDQRSASRKLKGSTGQDVRGDELRVDFLSRMKHLVGAAAFRLAFKAKSEVPMGDDNASGWESLCDTSRLRPHLETALVSLFLRAEQTVVQRRSQNCKNSCGTEASQAMQQDEIESVGLFQNNSETTSRRGAAKTTSKSTSIRLQRNDQVQLATAAAGSPILARATTKTTCFESRTPGDFGSSAATRQLRTLIARHRITPHLVASDSQGRVAIVERREILLCSLSNTFPSVEDKRPGKLYSACRDTPISSLNDAAAARARVCVLRRLSATFDVVAVEFNPIADQHLAAWGIRDVVVYALDGGEHKRKSRRRRRKIGALDDIFPKSSSMSSRRNYDAGQRLRSDAVVRVELSGLDSIVGGEAAHVVTCKWIPGKTTVLAVATSVSVRVYDLSVDAAAATNVFVLAYDQHRIRDATIAPPHRFLSGCGALYVILDTGRVYGAELHDDSGGEASRSDVYLDLDALPMPSRLFADTGAGKAIYYAPRGHVLVVSREGAPATAIRLGDTSVRDVRGGYKLLSRTPPRRSDDSTDGLRQGAPSSSSASTTLGAGGDWSPYAAWLEWPKVVGEKDAHSGDVDSQRPLELIGVMRCENPLKPGEARSTPSVLLPSTKSAGRDSVVLLTRKAEDAFPIAYELDLDDSDQTFDSAAPSTSLTSSSSRLSRRIVGACTWQHTANTNSLLVLVDDGSLRLYDNNSRDDRSVPSAIAYEVKEKKGDAAVLGEAESDDSNEKPFAEDLSSLVSGMLAGLAGGEVSVPVSRTDTKSAPPCTIFESLSLVNADQVALEGDLCGSSSREDAQRRQRSSSDHYLVSSCVDGGSGLICVPKPGKVAAVRVLVGSASSEHIPSQLVVSGKCVNTLRERRWYDFILDDRDRERATTFSGVVISILGSHRTGTPPAIDAIEVYYATVEEVDVDEGQAQNAAIEKKRTVAGISEYLSERARKSTAPFLQRALVAAIKARAALEGHDFIPDDSKPGVYRLDSSFNAENDKSIGLKDQHATLQELHSVEKWLIQSISTKSLATVAMRLVEVTCVAGESVQWPGIRSAAIALCDIVCNFDRLASRRLFDIARLRRLRSCVNDESILSRSSASVAFLALSLVCTRPTAYFEATRTFSKEGFLFPHLLDRVADGAIENFRSAPASLSLTVEIGVNLACHEISARSNAELNAGMALKAGVEMLRRALESHNLDVSDAATAMFANWLAESILTASQIRCAREEQAAAKPIRPVETAEEKILVAAHTTVIDVDEDDQKVEEEQRETKGEGSRLKLVMDESTDRLAPPKDDSKGISESGSTSLADVALPFLFQRVSEMVSAIISDLSDSSQQLDKARLLVRYVSTLLIMGGAADETVLAKIIEFVSTQLRLVLATDASRLRYATANDVPTHIRHAPNMASHDGVAWRGDEDPGTWFCFVKEVDAIRADTSVLLLKALKRLSATRDGSGEENNLKRVSSGDKNGENTSGGGANVNSNKKSNYFLKEVSGSVAAAQVLSMALMSTRTTCLVDFASRRNVVQVTLRDAIVARFRRALATVANEIVHDDEDDEEDEVGDQETAEDNVDDEDENAPFRRAFYFGEHPPPRKTTGDSLQYRSKRILLKGEPGANSCVDGFGDGSKFTFSSDRSDPRTSDGRRTTRLVDDRQAEHATVTLLYAEAYGETSMPHTKDFAPFRNEECESLPSSREWWTGLFIPSCHDGNEEALTEIRHELTDAQTTPSDARAALAFISAVVDTCGTLRGGSVTWPAAFSAALCETIAHVRLPRSIRRSAKGALRRVCGGSSLEYRSLRDTHAYATKVQLIRDAASKPALDHAESVKLENALMEILAVAKNTPQTWRTFCSRPLLVAESAEAKNAFADFSDEEDVQISSRDTHVVDKQGSTVCALFQLTLALPSESNALRLCLQLLKLCMRPPTLQHSLNDDICEDARAEAESTTRRSFEESSSSSNPDSITQVLQRAAQRRRFARFLGFATPASLVKRRPSDVSRAPHDRSSNEPISRAAVALVDSFYPSNDGIRFGSRLTKFASRIVVDGANRTIRECGAAFLRHVYLVLPAEEKIFVFEHLAASAPRETMRSVGKRGIEQLDALAWFVNLSPIRSECTTVDRLAADICSALKSCATALDSRRDILEMYAVTDLLGLPRYFDGEGDGVGDDDTQQSRHTSQLLTIQDEARKHVPNRSRMGRLRSSDNGDVVESGKIVRRREDGHRREPFAAVLRRAHPDFDLCCLPHYDSTEPLTRGDESISAALNVDDSTRLRTRQRQFSVEKSDASNSNVNEARDDQRLDHAGVLRDEDERRDDEVANQRNIGSQNHKNARSIRTRHSFGHAEYLTSLDEHGLRRRKNLAVDYASTCEPRPFYDRNVSDSLGKSMSTDVARFAALDDVRKNARFTESCAMVQLRGVRRISEIELRVREARCRQPRLIKVHYCVRPVDNIASLSVPANWSEWKIAAELRLRRGRTNLVRHKFTTPVIAANLLFEYDEFFDLNSTSQQSTTSSSNGYVRRRRATDEDDTGGAGPFFSAMTGFPPSLSRVGDVRQGALGRTYSTSLQDRSSTDSNATHRAVSDGPTKLDTTEGARENSGSAALYLSDAVFAATYRRARTSGRRTIVKQASDTNEFPNATRGRGGTLHCPRCGRRVADAHGVCQHCGEVAFQCRQCRHINYERLDAFLCVECGFCAFGEFSWRLRSEAAPDALSIRSKQELEAACARLTTYAETARNASRALRRLLPESTRLARSFASTESRLHLFVGGFDVLREIRTGSNMRSENERLQPSGEERSLHSSYHLFAPPSLQQPTTMSNRARSISWLGLTSPEHNVRSAAERASATGMDVNRRSMRRLSDADIASTSRLPRGGSGLPLPLLRRGLDSRIRSSSADEFKLPTRSIPPGRGAIGTGHDDDGSGNAVASLARERKYVEESRKFYRDLQRAARSCAALVRSGGIAQPATPGPDDSAWGAVDTASCALVAAVDAQSFATHKFCAGLAAETGALVATTMASHKTLLALYDREESENTTGDDETFTKFLDSDRDTLTRQHGRVFRAHDRPRMRSLEALRASSRTIARITTFDEDDDDDRDIAFSPLRATRGRHSRSLNVSRSRVALSLDDDDDDIARVSRRDQSDHPRQLLNVEDEVRQRVRRNAHWGAASDSDVSASFAAAFSSANRRASGIRPSATVEGSRENAARLTSQPAVDRRRPRPDDGVGDQVDNSTHLRRRCSQHQARSVTPGGRVIDASSTSAENRQPMFEQTNADGGPRLNAEYSTESADSQHQRMRVPSNSQEYLREDVGQTATDVAVERPDTTVEDRVATSPSRDHIASPVIQASAISRRRSDTLPAHRHDIVDDANDESFLSRLLQDGGDSSEDDNCGFDDDTEEEDMVAAVSREHEAVDLDDIYEEPEDVGPSKDIDSSLQFSRSIADEFLGGVDMEVEEDDEGNDDDDDDHDDEGHNRVLGRLVRGHRILDQDEEEKGPGVLEIDHSGRVNFEYGIFGRSEARIQRAQGESSQSFSRNPIRRKRTLSDSGNVLQPDEAATDSGASCATLKRAALEQLITSMYKRRYLQKLGLLTNVSVCGRDSAGITRFSSLSSPLASRKGLLQTSRSEDPERAAFVETYLGACGPLRTELQRAVKRGTEAAARIREYHHRMTMSIQEDGRSSPSPANEDTSTSGNMEGVLQQNTHATFDTIARLVDLGETIADTYDAELMNREGFVDALIATLASTLLYDSRAFRSASVALCTLCAKSAAALQKTHAAFRDLHGDFVNAMEDDCIEQRRTALYIVLRDFLCAPPPQRNLSHGSAWMAHVNLAARHARDIAHIASTSRKLAESELKPCLAVICRLVGARVLRRQDSMVCSEITPASDMLRWIQSELCRTTRTWIGANWVTPAQARATLRVRRAFYCWATRSSISRCHSVRQKSSQRQQRTSWLLAAVNHPNCEAVRRQMALLLLAAARRSLVQHESDSQFQASAYACLEAVCSMALEVEPSRQLLAVLAELVVEGDTSTKEYLCGRGFGHFCCRRIRSQALRLLQQDASYVSASAGGSDIAAAVGAARPLPELIAFASITASLAMKSTPHEGSQPKRQRSASMRGGTTTPDSRDGDVNWISLAALGVERDKKEELSVALEASLMFRELKLLRSRETDAVADVLARVALCPFTATDKKRAEENSRTALMPAPNEVAVQTQSVEDRLSFLAAATTTLKRTSLKAFAHSPSKRGNDIKPSYGIAARCMHVLAGRKSDDADISPAGEVQAHSHAICALTSTSLELLLESMSDASCPRQVKPHIAIQLRRAPTQDEFFRGNLPCTSISLDDVPRSRAGRANDGDQSDDDDVDDSNDEPTMGDLRRKIAVDLDMADAAEMLELVVWDCIVSLHLPIRQVYTQLWLPRARAAAAARSRRQATLGAFALGSGGADSSAMLHDEDDDEDGDGDEDDDEDMPPAEDDDDDEDHPRLEGTLPMDEDDDEDEDDYVDLTTRDAEQRSASLSDASSFADVVVLGDSRVFRSRSAVSGQAASRDEGTSGTVPHTFLRRRRQAGVRDNDAAPPAMIVTYRLTGVDGEATEERIERLGDKSHDQKDSRVIDRYGATTAIVESGGMSRLVSIIADSDDDAVAARALRLLRQCAMIERHAVILAKMGAPTSLLARLVRALQRGDERRFQASRSDRDVERLLGLLERLAPAMRDVTTSVEASAGQATHLETLVDGLRDARVAAALERTPALRRAVCRLLPALACGRRDAADALALRMTAWMRRPQDWVRCFESTNVSLVDRIPKSSSVDGGVSDFTTIDSSTGASALDLVEASCLRETAEGLGGDDLEGDDGQGATANPSVNRMVAGAEELGDALARNGFILAACQALTNRVPSLPPRLPWSPRASRESSCEDKKYVSQAKWRRALEIPGVRGVVVACLRALRGACVASRQCGIVALEHGAVDAAHSIEQLQFKSMRDVGIAAEALLDAIGTGDDPAAVAAQEVREVMRTNRRLYAQARRSSLLSKLGLPEAPIDSGVASHAVPGEVETVTQDTQEAASSEARCVVCREDALSRPRDVLGAYIYVKLAVPDVGDADGAFLFTPGSALAPNSTSPSASGSAGTVLASSRFTRLGSRALPVQTTSATFSQRRRGSQRRFSLVSSVSAFNVIHISCHREATHAERTMRSPRAEWDGATLRNSRVLCNSILPMRPRVPSATSTASDSSAAAVAYAAAIDRHFSSLGQFGISSRTSSTSAAAIASPSSIDTPSRFTIIAHDAQLLLLRLAHGESLHAESGGGSRSSNLLLVCYLMQLGAHLLTSRSAGGAAVDNTDIERLREVRRLFFKEAFKHVRSTDEDQSYKSTSEKSYLSDPNTGDISLVFEETSAKTRIETPQADSTSRGVEDEHRLFAADRTDGNRRQEMLARITECFPHVALATIFDDEAYDDVFHENKALFATFAAHHALARAESRAAARAQQRRGATFSPTRSRSDSQGSVETDVTSFHSDASQFKNLDAQTHQRARSYTKSMLVYLALLDRIKQEFRVLSREDIGGRVPLLSGDDSAISAAAERVTTFFENSLMEVTDPRVILVEYLKLDQDSLMLSTQFKALLFAADARPRARTASHDMTDVIAVGGRPRPRAASQDMSDAAGGSAISDKGSCAWSNVGYQELQPLNELGSAPKMSK